MFIHPNIAQKIADELKSTTGRDINIINNDGLIIASTNPARIGFIHEGALRLLRESLPIVTIYDWDTVKGAQQGINLPIVTDGDTAGVIGITGNPDEIMPLASVIRKMTELMLINLQKQEWDTALEQAKSMFYESWFFSASIDKEKLSKRASLLNIDIHRSRIVACVTLQTEGNPIPEIIRRKIVEHINYELIKEYDSFCFQSYWMLTIILCEDSQKKAEQKIHRLLSNACGYYKANYCCGLSAPTGKMEDLPQCYEDACFAVAAAERNGQNTVCSYDELSLEFLFRYVPAALKCRIKKKILFGCSEADQREVMDTVQLFFDCGGDIGLAAQRAFIHRNTMYYRIRQIKKLTGYSLQEPKESLLLYLVTKAED